MVASSTIKRLAEQIDALEARYNAKREHKVVFVTGALGETQDAAWERHLIDHPEDADADVSIFTFYDDAIPGDCERARDLAAARQERLLERRGQRFV